MHRVSCLTALVLTTSALGFAACGDSAADDDVTTSTSGSTASGGTSTTTTTTTSTTGAASSSTGGGICEGPGGNNSPLKNVTLASVSGTVVDATGEAVGNHLAQLCGKDVCINGMTGANGAVTIANMNPAMDRPLFKAGDGLTYGRSAYEINVDGQMVDATTVPMTDSTMTFDPGAVLAAGGATLEMDPAGIVTFAIEFDKPDPTSFRGGEVPAAVIDDIAPGRDLAALWAFGPVETLICPAAKLTVPNTNAIPAGTQLDVYYQELSVFEDFGIYGTWNVVAEAEVSADGTTITTTDTHHLPVLGMVGFKAK